MAAFFEAGGRMIDSSPMYGSSQPVIGYGLQKLGRPSTLFSAEKVWTSSAAAGPAQIEQSRRFWGVPKFDLVQVHNLLAWKAHLQTLFEMKAAGTVRYVGITTSEGRRHDLLEQIMRNEPIDFVQFSYNVVDREAEQRLLPLASERGIAVIVNRPFRQGALTRRLKAEPLPEWAAELDVVKLVATDPEVHPLSSGRHRRDSGDHPRRPCAREPLGCRRTHAGPGHAGAHFGLCAGSLMSEWWTYRPEDFLLFSPRVYWRMFELHNAALWPLQVLTLAAGVIIILLVACAAGSCARWLALILAILWVFVGWTFLWNRYADINWAAAYVAPAFAVEGVLLLVSGSLLNGLTFDRRGLAGWTGYLILVFALAGQPLLAPLQGRGWASSEVFGIAPDPTAIATLGLLLLARGRLLPLLLPIPVLWCLLSGMTLQTMGEPQAWALHAALALAVAAWIWTITEMRMTRGWSLACPNPSREFADGQVRRRCPALDLARRPK